MDTYFTSKHFQSEIVKAIEEEKAKESQISSNFVVVKVGKNKAFFWPSDYSVIGFSLDEKDLETILAEVKARE